MKCKKLLGAICLFTTCAWAVPAQAYDSNLNDRHGYQSSSGTQYQYDLSRPSDQIRYSVNGNLKLTPFRDNRQSKFDPLDDIKSVN